MMDEKAFVSVRGLTKKFGERTVVANIDFDLRAGEFLSLLGPSGSGKTTILRMIAGLAHPDGGSIRIGDQMVYDGKKEVAVEERRLGMVFQDYALWPHMTVEKNITFGLRLRRLAQEEIRARVADALALVDLVGLERRYPNQLSGGQQQRVSLARALATQPNLLLMDEPLSSLDTGLREVMREELVRIFRKMQITVINVTHDQDEAMVMSERILLLRNGSVEQLGSPAELYEQPRTAFAGSFMGPVNVLRGTITEVSGATVTIRAQDALLIGRRRPDQPVTVGDAGILLCRLEHVQLRSEAPRGDETTANVIEGVVSRASFAGGRWRVMTRVNPEIEIAAVSQTAPQHEGKVWLVLPHEHVLLVAPDDFDIRTADGPREVGQGAVLAGVI